MKFEAYGKSRIFFFVPNLATNGTVKVGLKRIL